MLRKPNITFPFAASISQTREDKLNRYLLFVNMGFLAITVAALLLSSLDSLQNNYYPLGMSVIGITVTSIYFLHKGLTRMAVNLINFLPVPVYFTVISPVFAILPPDNSYYIHALILSSGMLFLLIFADKKWQLYTFFIVSVGSLLYHFYSTGDSSKILNLIWAEPELMVNPLLFLSIIFFITLLLFTIFHGEVKKYELMISAKDAALKNMVYHLPLGIIKIKIERDEAGEKSGMTIDHINPAFEESLNIKNSEVKGESAASVFQKIFKNEVNWQELFLNTEKTSNEIFLPHSGQWYKVIVMHPNKDVIVGFFENITDVKLTFKDLADSRYRYKLLLETIPDIFFVIDKEGTFIDYVAKDEDGNKYSTEEIIGSTIFEVGYSKKMVKQVFKSIQTVVNRDVIETIEYVLEVVGKGSCFFEMRMVKLTEDSVMAVSRDITKQKIAQQKIEEARKKAEEADQLKSAFLQNISHEVRTPLNAIIGFSNVLMVDDDLDRTEKRNYLQLIIRNGQILLHIFNDTIKLSRIQSGLMEVDKKFIYLNSTMTDLYRQFLSEKQQLGKEHLKLTLIRGNENAKFSVCADGQKIKDIMESLLDNAVKFTHEGEIHFGYRIINGGKLEFFVNDTGIGIPEDKHEEIFRRFYQLDSGTTREFGGTGIGLSLARDFARLLGTNVEVQSSPGNGSRFSFIIPFEAGEGHLKIV